MSMESPEECLREAEECERLAGLARSIASRQMIMVIAFKWRRLAERAAERRRSDRPHGIQAQAVFGKPRKAN